MTTKIYARKRQKVGNVTVPYNEEKAAAGSAVGAGGGNVSDDHG